MARRRAAAAASRAARSSRAQPRPRRRQPSLPPSAPPPPLEIIHCDNHLLVVNKAACTPSVPDASGDDSAMDQARAAVKDLYKKPGEAWLTNVHRLDRPVSGLLAFARTSKGASRLSRAFAASQPDQAATAAVKVYWGLVAAPSGRQRGELSASDSGVVSHWLRKDRATNTSHVVRPGAAGAREARTEWRVLQRGADEWLPTLVEFRPVTGRPHQIRLAAAAALGAPLLGDLRYGGRSAGVGGGGGAIGGAAALSDRSIALHHRSLELPHPTNGMVVEFRAPPPMPLVLKLDRPLAALMSAAAAGETGTELTLRQLSVWGRECRFCETARAVGAEVVWRRERGGETVSIESIGDDGAYLRDHVMLTPPT